MIHVAQYIYVLKFAKKMTTQYNKEIKLMTLLMSPLKNMEMKQRHD